MKKTLAFASLAVCAALALVAARSKPSPPPLWQVYEQTLKRAKYVDLTHTTGPSIPVWAGFGPSSFGPAVNPKTGKAYTYKDDGFESSAGSSSTATSRWTRTPPRPWKASPG